MAVVRNKMSTELIILEPRSKFIGDKTDVTLKLAPNQTGEIHDEFSWFPEIRALVDAGKLEILSYSTDPGSFVTQAELNNAVSIAKMPRFAMQFGRTIPVPGAGGVLYLASPDGVTCSSAGPIMNSNGSILGGSVNVDIADASNDYDIEFLTEPSSGAPNVVETLSLLKGNREVLSRSFSTTFLSGTEIGVRVVRTSGSGDSAFTTCTVYVEINAPYL